jgi:hypothetical protein
MNQAQALAKLRKVYGTRVCARVDDKAPTESERDEARAKLRDANAKKKEAAEALEARRAELLRDPVFQKLRAEHQAADREASELLGRTYRHRITVGVAVAGFFSVKAEGDNWSDVVAKATGSST